MKENRDCVNFLDTACALRQAPLWQVWEHRHNLSSRNRLAEMILYVQKRQDFFICSTHRGNKDKCSGKRRQKVHIEYDLVGYIPVDKLLKAGQA